MLWPLRQWGKNPECVLFLYLLIFILFFYWLLQYNGVFWFVKAESLLTLATLLSVVGCKNPAHPTFILKEFPSKGHHFVLLLSLLDVNFSFSSDGWPHTSSCPSSHCGVSKPGDSRLPLSSITVGVPLFLWSGWPSSHPYHLCWLWRIPSVSWIKNITLLTVSKFQPLEWHTHSLDMYMEEPASRKCFRHLTKRRALSQVITVPVAPLKATRLRHLATYLVFCQGSSNLWGLSSLSMEDKQRKAEVSLGHQKPQCRLPFLAHRTVNSNEAVVGASTSPQSLPHGSFCIASSQDPRLLCLPFFFWLFQFSLLQFLPSMAWTVNVFTSPSTRPSCPPPLRDPLLILNEAPPTSRLICVCVCVLCVRDHNDCVISRRQHLIGSLPILQLLGSFQVLWLWWSLSRERGFQMCKERCRCEMQMCYVGPGTQQPFLFNMLPATSHCINYCPLQKEASLAMMDSRALPGRWEPSTSS